MIWVGGMFFAYLILRPSVGSMALAERLPLWSRVLGRFFRWVWVAIILLPVTGYWMIFGHLGGMGSIAMHVHLMQGLGWLMILLFLHVFFAPWRRLRASLEVGTLEEAARQLDQIRLLVAVNLALGLIVVAVAAGGRYGLLA